MWYTGDSSEVRNQRLGEMERLWTTSRLARLTLPAQSVPAVVRWDTMDRKRQRAELLANPATRQLSDMFTYYLSCTVKGDIPVT